MKKRVLLLNTSLLSALCLLMFPLKHVYAMTSVSMESTDAVPALPNLPEQAAKPASKIMTVPAKGTAVLIDNAATLTVAPTANTASPVKASTATTAVCAPTALPAACVSPRPATQVPRKPVRVRSSMAQPAVTEPVYAPVQPLSIVLGEIKLVPVKGKVTRVALGNGNIVSATAVDKNLLLIAEQVGDTSLMVWSGNTVASYRVQVLSKDMTLVRSKVEALIGDNKGIVITQVGPDLMLSGTAHREVLARIGGRLAELPNVVNNIQEDQGSAFTRSVLFRLTFVEVKRTLLEQLGINWANDAAGPTIGATGVAKNTGIYGNISPPRSDGNLLAANPEFITRNGATRGIFFGLATTLTSRLNLGITDGDARVLASPELTARSGGKARLQVGGEVPIPLTGAFGATTVEFKPYGMLFDIEPTIDASDTISAKLSTELSQIDTAVSVGGIPGFITRNTATEVSIKPGEIVALSGLVNSELSSAIDRVPALSRIPIFGRLFRSDDFRNNKTELVVLVQAEIIKAGDGLAAQLRERGLEEQREFERKVQGSTKPPFDMNPSSPARRKE